MAHADILHTERLVLRRARAVDLDAFHAVLSDPKAMRYWSSVAHTDIGQTREWLDSMIGADPAESDDFVITLDGQAIGKMGAYRLPEFGFILRPAYWGRGLASEALDAFIAHRRRVAPGSTLRADVDPRNAASLGLLHRHGFAETGRAKATWTVGGEVCDSVYLALDL